MKKCEIRFIAPEVCLLDETDLKKSYTYHVVLFLSLILSTH